MDDKKLDDVIARISIEVIELKNQVEIIKSQLKDFKKENKEIRTKLKEFDYGDDDD